MSLWRRLVAWIKHRFVRHVRRKVLGEHAVVDVARRATLRATPLTDHQRLLLETWFPPFNKLSSTHRAKLSADVQVFLGEKQFAGDGLELDERMRLVVSASAALLVLGLDIAAFDHVTRVVIRHEAFEGYGEGVDVHGHYVATTHSILGRSGEIELRWSAVDDGLSRADGAHVVIHELAHAFDHGLKLLQSHAERAAWEAALRDLPLHTRFTKTHALTQHVGSVEGNELFAVASELFFEVPRRLVQLAPSLFEELRTIYNVDPRTFTKG